MDLFPYVQLAFSLITNRILHVKDPQPRFGQQCGLQLTRLGFAPSFDQAVIRRWLLWGFLLHASIVCSIMGG